jgi:hypothetical protein
LPKRLADGAVDGAFAISVAAVYGGKTAAASTAFRGVRSTTHPVAKPARFEVLGPGGVIDAVSGLGGALIHVKYLDCDSITEIGIQFGLTEPVLANAVFQPCNPAGNDFPLSDFSLPTKTGDQLFSFFLRDQFGNASEPVVDDSNRRSVFFDIDPPDLAGSSLTLGVDFGFAPATAAPGTDAAPYDFQNAPLLELRSQGFTNDVVLRFANPASCRTAPLAGQVGADDRDLTINTFDVVNAAGAHQVAVCTGDLPVSEQDLTFPASDGDAAHVTVTVADSAGNAAVPVSYEIPPCSTAGVKGACWER